MLMFLSYDGMNVILIVSELTKLLFYAERLIISRNLYKFTGMF